MLDAELDHRNNDSQTGHARQTFPLGLFAALFLPVMFLILGGGWYVGQDRVEEQLGLMRANEINHVVMGVRRLDDELHTPLQQLRTLALDIDVLHAIEEGTPEAIKSMEQAFIRLMTYNPEYDKVRWIDETGMERARVNNINGRTLRVARDALQRQSESYYFKEALRMKAGEVYISPLDLNVENGKIETPHKPVLRLALRVTDRLQRTRGILIVNVAAGGLLNAFSDSLMEARDHAMLLNSEGYWLHSPDAKDAWGFMFKRADSTLAARHPAAWQFIADAPSGQVEVADGLWTWSTVYPLKVEHGRDTSHIPSWLVVSHLSQSQLALARDGAWASVRSYTLLLLAVYGVLSAWLAFAVVSRTQAKVEAAHARAEAEHAQRISEAQERFRLVVQANTNGLLVADSRGRIVLANPALERMFGYEPDELLGQSVEALLPHDVRAGHGAQFAAYFAQPSSRAMGVGRDLRGIRKDGEIFPIEISLSPFMEKGEIFVDAFVADISERKRVERLHELSEARLKMLVETNPNGLLIISDAGAIEMANPALEQMFGYTHGELYNRALERILPRALNPDCPTRNSHLDLATCPQGQKLTMQGAHKDGTPFTLGITLTPFAEEGRALMLAVVTV